MEQTVFRRKPPATLRERVAARREREQSAPRGLPAPRALSSPRGSSAPRDLPAPEPAWNQIAPLLAALLPGEPSARRVGVLAQARHARFLHHQLPGLLVRLLLGLVLVSAAFGLLRRGASSGKAALQRSSAAAGSSPAGMVPASGRRSSGTLPAALPSLPAKRTTLLLLGSDQRPDDPSFRTDVVVLLTIDPAKGTVSAVSFPRDLIANIPGYGDDRINVVMQSGGFPLMQETFAKNYGARPDYYFMTNFSGFADLINSIGGIEIDAAEPLTDACDLYWSTAGQCEITPGKHALDGAGALWYIRSRHTSSDFDRLRRAQEVLVAVFARFMSMNALARLPELYAQYHQDIQTNMDPAQVMSLLPVAAQVAADPARIQRYAITPNEAADWWMPNGARVLLPDYEAVRRIVHNATGQ